MRQQQQSKDPVRFKTGSTGIRAGSRFDPSQVPILETHSLIQLDVGDDQVVRLKATSEERVSTRRVE